MAILSVNKFTKEFTNLARIRLNVPYFYPSNRSAASYIKDLAFGSEANTAANSFSSYKI
jgi:hypothetical protein